MITVKRSLTETPNALTADIDMATPLEIVRMLRSTDAQIFSGYGGYPGFADPEIVEKLARLAVLSCRTLSRSNNKVVLSGAGTSGRLAMFTARTFNEIASDPDSPIKSQQFVYTIAGGNAALIQAQEGAEDDPAQGAADLKAAAAGADEIFYVGITCGMSAPYIAGQLKAMLDGEVKGHAVLLGFNPVELARDTPIENWDGTFLDIARAAEAHENATVLTPIVGPEPITGSTRMKSGSATKLALETIFHAARAAAMEGSDTDDAALQDALEPFIRMLINDYESAVREAYTPIHELAALVEEGARALRAGGHIYYLGATGPELLSTCTTEHCGHDPEDHPELFLSTEAGILGLVDASECPPTYGATFEDVRGFVAGGWKAVLPGEADTLASLGPEFEIGLDAFEKICLPKLTQKDLVVLLGDFDDRDRLVKAMQSSGARTAAVVLTQSASAPPSVDILVEIQPTLSTISAEEDGDDQVVEDGDEESANTGEGAPLDPDEAAVLSGPTQLAFKLVLNALTTGAHVLAGKVYGNRMIDLRISNNKLFHRTVGIISDLMNVSTDDARRALVQATYETDSLTDRQASAPISDYIEAAKPVTKVVPKALLMATGSYSYAEASKALQANPVVRAVLEEHVAR